MTEDSNLAKKLEEKNKFTEEELKQVKSIQQSYQNIQIQFGLLKMNQIRLDEQEVELEDALKNIQSEEKTFLDGITKKYGEGTLNPETGEFTSNKSN